MRREQEELLFDICYLYKNLSNYTKDECAKSFAQAFGETMENHPEADNNIQVNIATEIRNIIDKVYGK